MRTSKNVVIHENTKIGKDPVIEDFVVLGKPPRGSKSGELELIIGDFPILRCGTIIYAGNVIGSYFQTGDQAKIREKNKIGDRVSIGAGSVIEGGCEIKDSARIHSNSVIAEYTVIEENAWVGPLVNTFSVLHPPCPAFKKYAPVYGEKCCHGPTIKKNAVIGGGSVVMPGVVVGENAVVGAGSLVTKDVAAGCVVVGNPAKFLKKVEELDCPLGFYKKGEVYVWRKS